MKMYTYLNNSKIFEAAPEMSISVLSIWCFDATVLRN